MKTLPSHLHSARIAHSLGGVLLGRGLTQNALRVKSERSVGNSPVLLVFKKLMNAGFGAFRSVVSRMSRAGVQLKVLNPVVSLNLVNMVYNFFVGKLSPKMALHNMSMFKNLRSVQAKLVIAVRGNPFFHRKSIAHTFPIMNTSLIHN